jgi:hypothetical protein
VNALRDAAAEAGGTAAPPAATAHLRTLLDAALADGARELAKARSGYGSPVHVAFASAGGHVLAATPVGAALRADPQAIPEREWLLAAATVAALVELGGPAEDALTAGDRGGRLVLAVPGDALDGDLAVLAFEEHVTGIDRLRATAVALPGAVVGEVDLRAPVGEGHPLRVAEKVARLGGDPTDPASLEAHEEAVLATVRPHADPDPGKRVARRILQRLDGMGKWGGYHTEFAHLARGFAGNDRALAQAVGERLLAAGLLAEKPSVGQRHVFLDPGRAGDIRRLIDDGELPSGLTLPQQ